VASVPGCDAPPLLQTIGLCKRFGDFSANEDIDISVRAGSIHALLGENGAGKSTLVKMIYGVLQPSSGELRWCGQPMRVRDPGAARELGIGMVFQHFSLFDALSVTENIALALPRSGDMRALARRIETLSAQYGLPLRAHELVADLSVGQRQRIEIVRCLLQKPRLLIMDEPTAVLTPQEAEQLFVTLRRLADEGCAVLYISHRLEEVQRLCQHATILRHGKVVAEVDPRAETPASLARRMVGADVHAVQAGAAAVSGERRLVLDHLELEPEGPFGVPLRGVSLCVGAGEVLAIAGVAGNGQAELFSALSGERKAGNADSVRIDGESFGHRGISARRRAGCAFVAEERLGHGAVPAFALAENLLLTRHASDAGLGGLFVDRRRAGAITERVKRSFDVRAGHGNPAAVALSGGNLQKFVVGREMDRSPRILVVNQPTWGVDAGAAALIRQALVDHARAGAAVLVISQDLDEIFEIADAIAVISRGELSPRCPARELDREAVGLLMAGVHERVTREATSP
jgi:simple sugar transport system ATP-binding protein